MIYMDRIYCWKCGSEIFGKAKLCTYCGSECWEPSETTLPRDVDAPPSGDRAHFTGPFYILDPCWNCKLTLQKEYKFCPKCGLTVPGPRVDNRPRCASCRRLLTGRERYCPDCGGTVMTPETLADDVASPSKASRSKWRWLRGQ